MKIPPDLARHPFQNLDLYRATVITMARSDRQIYEDTLIVKKLGFPLWQGDFGNEVPPGIGAIGYFECALSAASTDTITFR
jgi:hypothetical protein